MVKSIASTWGYPNITVGAPYKFWRLARPAPRFFKRSADLGLRSRSSVQRIFCQAGVARNTLRRHVVLVVDLTAARTGACVFLHSDERLARRAARTGDLIILHVL